MPGLVPGIHVAPFPANPKVSGSFATWMTGTSPVMTAPGCHPSARTGRYLPDRIFWYSCAVSFSYSAPVMTLKPGGMPLAAIAASESAT
jgi:hypothetical protein